MKRKETLHATQHQHRPDHRPVDPREEGDGDTKTHGEHQQQLNRRRRFLLT